MDKESVMKKTVISLASLSEGEQVLSCLPPCLPLRGRWHGEAVTEGVKYSFAARLKEFPYHIRTERGRCAAAIPAAQPSS